MGWTPETEDFPGHLGIEDAWPVSRPTTIQNSSGGQSVVWAEENSRDSIFSALRRKETYGTSGTRITVRLFGGWDFDGDACSGDLVAEGYGKGVPMGGDLGAPPQMADQDGEGRSLLGRSASSRMSAARSARRYPHSRRRPPFVPRPRQPRTSEFPGPRFIVAAWKDDFPPATNLQQIQIVKGWVTEEAGELVTKEKVIRVAGNPGNPNRPEDGIVERSCRTRPGGFRHLCSVWEDPDFDPSERAFYYARVIEEPVCRYSTHWCRERIGVDPLDQEQCREDLLALAGSGDPALVLDAVRGALCCAGTSRDDPILVQPVIQERAWTSPIFYEPEPEGEALF